jgi:hypothetical protein
MVRYIGRWNCEPFEEEKFDEKGLAAVSDEAIDDMQQMTERLIQLRNSQENMKQ